MVEIQFASKQKRITRGGPTLKPGDYINTVPQLQ